ncbi:Sec-independent protein translocase subunit TatA [Amycolatopsis alkalitolerans]|uniref:Sec-independent protein translocase protein TatA n=1 Tax=Amycolatopsis alkalitolerans TaxID=2547244 RepID=A0A5C4M1U6_9PSEU|nr:Sec-independent protein translocase subunit TatA [Amycolatopsis alkalitolerans]TNC25446.1 twin-arginine translocase TatA/TatE family subunit [Amycolatopsis alkalitolerans]
MLNGLQPWHVIILVLLVVLLFGAKRLPDAARSIGKSMKIFRAETKDMREEETATEPEKKELPSATAQPAGTDQQVADLQRQLDELKKQQDQAQKHAS